MPTRKEIFVYEPLPFYGKLSIWWGNRIIISHLQNGNWLDLLCGHKALLQFSQRNNHKISHFYCLDHKLDKNLKKYNFSPKTMTINKNLPYWDSSFDNVTVVNGLEHLWHPREILKECYRVLKPKGILQITVPTWFGKPFLEFLGFKMRVPQAVIEMDDHKTYYDEKTLWPMLVAAGFKPEKIELKRIKFYCSLYAKATKR